MHVKYSQEVMSQQINFWKKKCR